MDEYVIIEKAAAQSVVCRERFLFPVFVRRWASVWSPSPRKNWSDLSIPYRIHYIVSYFAVNHTVHFYDAQLVMALRRCTYPRFLNNIDSKKVVYLPESRHLVLSKSIALALLFSPILFLTMRMSSTYITRYTKQLFVDFTKVQWSRSEALVSTYVRQLLECWHHISGAF